MTLPVTEAERAAEIMKDQDMLYMYQLLFSIGKVELFMYDPQTDNKVAQSI